MLFKRILVVSAFIKIVSTVVWFVSGFIVSDISQSFSIFTILFKYADIYAKAIEDTVAIMDIAVLCAVMVLWPICFLLLCTKRKTVTSIGCIILVALCLVDILYAINSIFLIFSPNKMFNILFSMFEIVLVWLVMKTQKNTN